jgi:glycoprotein endo-alpha-1,2-mannosidase
MYQKVIIACLTILSFFSGAFAANVQWLGAVNNSWNVPENWSNYVLPTLDDTISIAANPGPIIDSNAAFAFQIRVGGTSGANLTMNGGTLNASEWLMSGVENSASSGSFTMNGGTINLGTVNPGNGHLWIGYGSVGTFTMNGGTISVPGRFGLAWAAGGDATVHLNGGTITANSFSMKTSGVSAAMDITDGTLIIDDDLRSLVNGYVSNGWITGFGGSGAVSVDYDITNFGKTTVKAINPKKAKSPFPANNAVDVMPDVNVSWTAGSGAASHDVYFGTASPGTFRGNQTQAAFDPGQLSYNTTYYWRIDEVNGPNTVMGDVWKFTTVSKLAGNPNPGNGAWNVPLNKVIHWTPGIYGVSHDVYFGTDLNGVANAQRLKGDLDGSGQIDCKDLLILTNYWLKNPAGSEPYAGVNDDNIVDFTDYMLLANDWMAKRNSFFKGNTVAATYDPCGLTLNTTYYWRVDEINGREKQKGDVWSFTATAIDSNYSLVGKIMCGYQGWFNCPNDGTTRGWVHWGRAGFSPTNCTVDFWPDMSEMGEDEKYEAIDFDVNDTHYYVFSSHNRNTVLRHFRWMRDYGIDGVYVQRFANEVKNQTSANFYNRNDVLSYCRDGANMYGRVYAVMYDLSGLGQGGTSKVISDWKYLVGTMKIGRDPNDLAYMRHKGRPVVAVWGIGFNDGRQYTLPECFDLVDFLKNDPFYGDNIVMVGVPSYWRELKNDCVPDTMVHTIVLASDIVSPWAVGRYSNTSGVNSYLSNVWAPDIQWCQSHNIEYLPVIFPGFSWWNLHNKDPNHPLNQIPRVGGQFLWDQVNATVNAGATMIYQAMFDEIDEGTAIFKISNNPPRPGGVDMFVTPSYDGIPLPSDEYLWLVGQAGKALRSEISLTSTRPTR